MNQLPKGLLHNLEYYMSEYTLQNYTITGGETTIISIRFHTASHIEQGELGSVQHKQYYRPKSSGAVARDKQRQELWSQKKAYDSGVNIEDSMKDTVSTELQPVLCSTPFQLKHESPICTPLALNCNAKIFTPMSCTTTNVHVSTITDSDVIDKECSTDKTVKPLTVDQACQPCQSSSKSMAVQSLPDVTSVMVQTAKAKQACHYVQTLKISSNTKQTITDSSRQEHIACQCEHIKNECDQHTQTDPYKDKHSQTESAAQSSKCLMATPLRHQHVQTLSKKEMKISKEKTAPSSSTQQAKHQEDTYRTPSVPQSDDREPNCNNQDGACCADEHLEEVSLQDILDLLIKINNR